MPSDDDAKNVTLMVELKVLVDRGKAGGGAVPHLKWTAVPRHRPVPRRVMGGGSRGTLARGCAIAHFPVFVRTLDLVRVPMFVFEDAYNGIEEV